MGALLSRTAGSSGASVAVRTVPAAAHKADAAAKAAIAAFPPIPTVPSAGGPPIPNDEKEANRGVAEMLSKTSIGTRAHPSAPNKAAAASSDAEAASGLPLDDLVAALRLHGETPQQWTAATLAKKFGVADEGALANALAHASTYRIVEDEHGRPRGVAIGEELPASLAAGTGSVEDLFAAHGVSGRARGGEREGGTKPASSPSEEVRT